jgi:CheY-like chemotaxis protein
MQTVLIVDDDPVFVRRLAAALTAANYRVLEATDGDEAMHVLEGHHREISLVVVDLVLPGTDGFQIIGAISRRPNMMKVIATTAVLKSAFLESCKYMGAHAVVRKSDPGQIFPADTWLETVGAVLSGA